MDLINSGTDPWILEFDSCEKKAREIMEDLNARGNDKISPQTYNALSGKIRIRLKQYSTEVSELGRKLNLASVVTSITPEEKERRKRQVETLQSKEVQLRDLFNQRKPNEFPISTNNENRAKLFEMKGRNTVFADTGVTSWGEGSNSQEPDGKSIEEMKQEQERLLKEQNEGLESLLKIVTAQNKMATTINNEVEHHNDILVDISDGMERVDGKINKATDIIKIVGKKDSIWGYWLVAFLLFIAILGVAFA